MRAFKEILFWHFVYALFLSSLFVSAEAYGDEPKAIVSRGDGELLEMKVNVSGSLVTTTSFGDPANCASSGALDCSGTYTPTLASSDQFTGLTLIGVPTFTRKGDVVTVAALVELDSADTSRHLLEMTTPIASSFSSPGDASGAATLFNFSASSGGLTFSNGCGVRARTSNNDIQIFCFPKTATANLQLSVLFQYRILP